MRHLKKLLLVAAAAATVSVPSQAAYIHFTSIPGLLDFFGGNSSGDNFQFSNTGAVGTFSNAPTNASSLNNSTPNITFFNTGATAYTDYSMFFVADNMLVAELDFDYLGNFAGQSNVQEITFNNFIAQGLAIAAPTTGGSINAMTLVNGGLDYRSYAGFDSHTSGIAFYNDALQVSASSVRQAAAANVPEPGSLALLGLGLAGLLGARRSRKQA